MTGRAAIEAIVEDERQRAFRKVEEFGGFERLADALVAEAALPARRPEWVTWARERAKEVRAMAAKLARFTETFRRGIPE